MDNQEITPLPVPLLGYNDATLYVWENPIDIMFLCSLLGGQVPPSEVEFATHAFNHSFFCTPYFQIRPCAFEQEKQAQIEADSFARVGLSVDPVSQRVRGFTTYELQSRLRKLGLDMPTQEIGFSPRFACPFSCDEFEKLTIATIELYKTGNTLLMLVAGTDLESGRMVVPPKIQAIFDARQAQVA